MRAIVTGGAGFVGSHLVDRLLSEGLEVIAVDNLITGSTDNIAHLGKEPRFKFLQHDISEKLEIEGEVNYIFHFAGPASPDDFGRLPIEILRVGSLGTLNSIELAREKGSVFMMASTSEVYGDPTVTPQPESYWGNVNPNGVRACYDEAKRFSEAVTVSYQRVYNANVRIVRLFNTYGPRMRINDGRIVPNLVAQALRHEPLTIYGDGHQTRCFGYYADIVDGISRLANKDFHEPVNIGSDVEQTVLEFAQEVIKAVGYECEIKHLPASTDDPRRRQPDLTRARALLGWSPSTPLSKGLEETIRYFKCRV